MTLKGYISKAKSVIVFPVEECCNATVLCSIPLNQGLADYCLWAKCSSPLVFVGPNELGMIFTFLNDYILNASIGLSLLLPLGLQT